MHKIRARRSTTSFSYLVDNLGLQVESYLDTIMKYLATILGTLILANAVLALPTGLPIGGPGQFAQVCMRMTPAHAGIAPQPGNGGYVITTDLPFINATEGYSYLAGQNATGIMVAVKIKLLYGPYFHIDNSLLIRILQYCYDCVFISYCM